MNKKFTSVCLILFFAWTTFVFAEDQKPKAKTSKTVSAKAPEKIRVKDKKTGLFADEVISVEELKKQMNSKKKPLILDARNKKSYDELHIRGAKLPLSNNYYKNQDLFKNGIIQMLPEPDSDLANNMKKYKKDTSIVTYCNDDCHASSILVLKLKKLGFKKVKALGDGIQTWQAKGGQVTSNDDPRIPSKV